MGSHLSCVSLADDAHHERSNAEWGTKVLHPETGRILEFGQPVSAAELMMDFPRHVVCHFSSWKSVLQLTLTPPQPQQQQDAAGSVIANHGYRRLAPLPADDELKGGELYLLLPLAKLHARLSPRDLAACAHAFHAHAHAHPSAPTLLSALRLASKSLNAKTTRRPEAHTHASIPTLPPAQPFRSLSFNSLPASCTSRLHLPHPIDDHPPDAPLYPPHGLICRSKSWMPKLDTITEVPAATLATIAF